MKNKISSRQPLTKGWSSDKKYKVVLESSQVGLLRIAERSAYENKKAEFDLMQKLAGQGLPLAEPLEFWTDGEAVYTLLEWLEGQDLQDVTSSLSEQELYDLGRQSGDFLRMLHTLPIDQSLRDWDAFYQSKIDSKIALYQASQHSYDKGQEMLDFIQANRHLIGTRPIAYQHGDFHTGNFLLGADGQLKVLDFDRQDIGDPWEEFNRLIFTAALSPAFARGQLDAYFEETIPIEFWRLLCLYLTVNSLGALAWAEVVDSEQIPLMKDQARMLADWYADFTCLVPKWYPWSG